MKYIFISGLFFILNTSIVGQDLWVEQYDLHCTVDKDFKLDEYQYILLKVIKPEGRDKSIIRIAYSEKSPIKKLSVTILDEHRRKVKTLNKNHIEDNSRSSKYFHVDGRVKIIEAIHNQYPYYIEVEYHQLASEFFSFPQWSPQMHKNIPSFHSSYTLTVPKHYKIHHRFIAFEPKLEVTETQSDISYCWSSGFTPGMVTNEAFGPPYSMLYAHGIFAPDNFKMGGLEGSTVNWKSFGNFITELNKGLDTLPLDVQYEIKNSVSNATTDLEKVELLYAYLQEHMRYVNISIGIGGWQPQSAEYVHNVKYGDCKALSNYMKTLLRLVDIPSFYALINSGYRSPDISPHFVSNQFNHAVLMVPLANDTIWLECTSQNMPCGYWGTDTQGKYALICNGQDSKLIKSPALNFKNNFVSLNARVSVEGTKLLADVSRQFAGNQFEDFTYINNNYNAKEKEEELLDRLPYDSFVIKNITYKKDSLNNMRLNEYSQIELNNHIMVYGEKMIVKPINTVLPLHYHVEKERKTDVYIARDERWEAKVNYQIPKGHTADKYPEDTEIEAPFGKFVQQVKQENSGVLVHKTLYLNSGLYTDSLQHLFYSFLSDVRKYDNQKILFIKSTQLD